MRVIACGIGYSLVIAVLAIAGAGIAVGYADPANTALPCDRTGASIGMAAYCDAKVDDLVDVPLADLHPTQAALGYDEVYYRLGRYTRGKDKVNKRFDDWCEANGQGRAVAAQPGAKLINPSSFTCEVPIGSETPETIAPMKTAVVGPQGQLYLTDGHHRFTSFWESPDGGPNMRLRVRIIGNLSNLEPAAFWQEMQRKGWTWLAGANDQPVTPEQLPNQLGLAGFGNDRYRGVLYFVRDIGYSQEAANALFQEFYWARWLRANAVNPALNLDLYNLDDQPSYLQLIRNIAEAQVALPDDAIVSDGRTAAELGKLPAVNDGEYAALSRPYSDEEPGKLAYALLYKTNR